MANDDIPGDLTEDAMPLDLNDPDQAVAYMSEVLGAWAVAKRLEGSTPWVAAAELINVLYDILQGIMGRSAVRLALLSVFEKSHDRPMTFMERDEAKKLLDQLSNARRKVEGQPYLVTPGGPDVHRE